MPTAAGPAADIAAVDPPNYKRNPVALADTTAPGRRAWRPWKRGLAVSLLYTVAALFFTWPLAFHLGTHTFNHIDPPFSAWRMAWVSHQLLNDPERLFEANIFWPARRTLAYSDAIPVQGVLAMPLLGAGLTPIEVANLFTILGVAASAAAAYVLARRLTGHTAGAVLAGFVFAFSPYFHDHLVHLELVWAMFTPLAFWAWHRSLERGGFRDGFLCVIFLLLQLLSSIYYGMFLALSLAVLGVATLAFRRFRLPVPALCGAIVATVVLAVVATEYARPYEGARMRLGERNSSETARYSAPPSAFVTTRPDNLLYGPATGEWHEQEKRLMPGVTPVVLAAAAFAPPVSAAAVVYGALTLFTVEGALGMNGHLYPELRRYLSPFRGLRAPARFGAFVQLSLGVLAAMGLANLVRRWPRRAALLTSSVFLLVTAEYAVAPSDLMRMPSATPLVYQWIAATQPKDRVILELPVPAPDGMPFEDHIYQYASTWHWRPLINGYSGNYYPPYVELLRAMRTFPEEPAISEMRRAGVQLVIVHKGPYRWDRYDRLVEQLDLHPAFQRLMIGQDWAAEVRVYAFDPGPAPPASTPP